MSFKTSFNFSPADRPVMAEDADIYESLHASWGERVVTGVAVALALLFVTTVAVLMGMA